MAASHAYTLALHVSNLGGDDSDVLITAGRDATVKSWDLRTGAQNTSFRDGTVPGLAYIFRPERRRRLQLLD